MNLLNEMFLTIPSLSKNQAFARSVVAAFCVSANPTLEEINDIKTAVSEAVTNCVVHGYRSGEGKIEISAKLYEDTVEIEIKDYGVGISDTAKAMQPFFTTSEIKSCESIRLPFMHTNTVSGSAFLESNITSDTSVSSVPIRTLYSVPLSQSLRTPISNLVFFSK